MRRNLFLFILASAAFIGAMIAALASTQQRDYELRGYVDATRTDQLPYRIPRLGVNAELTQYEPGVLEAQIDLMQTANIRWIRQLFFWDEIEAENDVFSWDSYDAIVAQVGERDGIELVAVLVNSPIWSRDARLDRDAPPDNPTDFADFAAAFANRYGDQIDYYQIWDEPNIALGWGNMEPNATDYAVLLQAAYSAINANDPDATIIAAALAPTTETGPQNLSDIIFLRQLYALGADDYADAFAAKPYGFTRSPYDRDISNDVLNFSRIVALREVMQENGDHQTPLWASNWGWNALPADWEGDRSIWGDVTQEQQLQYTQNALQRAEREWPWLGGMILQHWQPAVALDDPQWGFALIDSRDQAGLLLQTLIDNPIGDYASNGIYAAQNPYVRYKGVWTLSDIGADIGWVQDSGFTFDFFGTDIALQVRQGDYVAYFYPEISGGEINALPYDSEGNPYLLLQSGDLQPSITQIALTRNLILDNYTLDVVADELVPDEITNRWPLIGFVVSSGDLTTNYNRQIFFAWVTTLIAAIATFVTGWHVNWGPLIAPSKGLWHRLNESLQIGISIVTSLALLAGMIFTWGDGIPNILRRDSVQLLLSVFTAGLIYVNEPGIILTILASCALFFIIYQRIELGLMLVIFWSPFFLYPVELYQFAFPIAEVILLITFSAWSLRFFADWGRLRQMMVSQFIGKAQTNILASFTLSDWLIIFWVVLGCLALLWSKRFGIALTELRTLIVQPGLFYLVYRTIPIDKRVLLRLVDALIFAGLAVSLIGIVMYIQGESVITAEGGTVRLASVYGSPNNVSLLLGRCIPFALGFVLIKTDQRRYLFAIFALIIMMFALLLTQSAGGLFIGVPASILAVLTLVWHRKAILPIVAVIFIVSFGVFVAAQTPRFERMTNFSEGTNFYRLRVWESSINLIEDHPLTGAGLDQFIYEYRDTYILPDAWEEPDLSHPHNFILDAWIRLGIIGVLLFLATQLVFWRQLHSIYERVYVLKNSDPISLVIVIGIAGSMVNLLTHGLVDNSIYVLDLAYIYVFLLGSVVVFKNMRPIDVNVKTMV